MIDLRKISNIADCLFPENYFHRQVKSLPAVPTYFYHQLDPEEFEEICQKIIRHNFRTLKFGDLLEGVSIEDRCLLLTMDDGWSSVWSVAFPLARRYGISFTLFLVPDAIEESQECRTTLDDNIDPVVLIERDRSSRCMLTWGEVQAMYESGLVEVQSHSLNHAVVFTSEQPCEFCTPDTPFPRPDNVPILSRIEGQDVAEYNPPLGTPLYPSAPALAAPRRFLEDRNATERCIALVQEKGGSSFFKIEGWKNILEEVIQQAKTNRWENKEERCHRYRHDLLQAKCSIENRLPGSHVRAFAPPWGRIHNDILAIAQETGYEAIVLAYPFPELTQHSQLPLYPRLKGDAIWTLLDGPLLGTLRWWQSRQRVKVRQKLGLNP